MLWSELIIWKSWFFCGINIDCSSVLQPTFSLESHVNLMTPFKESSRIGFFFLNGKLIKRFPLVLVELKNIVFLLFHCDWNELVSVHKYLLSVYYVSGINAKTSYWRRQTQSLSKVVAFQVRRRQVINTETNNIISETKWYEDKIG